MDRLPEDVLGEVLRRIPPHSLAVCRCVCSAWRAAVDIRRLLLPHVLPHSVLDHCNGLILFGYDHRRNLYVCNPATRRLPLLDNKYQVIKTPPTTNIEESKHINPYLGRSENGVHYATVKKRELQVWALDESGGHKEWELKYHVNLDVLTCQIQSLRCYLEQLNRPWTISDSDDEDEMGGLEADSDDEDVEEDQPVKNGSIRPNGYYGSTTSLYESFIYTPCLVDSLTENDH
uniref:F-box domain-containing protein n=1 Tax=Setaria italica TaxID=4555 RepID=K3YDP5_SETIT